MDKSLLQSSLTVGTCLVLGLAVFILAKQQKLNFRYAVGWLTLCTLGMFASLGTSLMEPIANGLGVSASAIIGLTAMFLIVLIAIQLSVSISGLQLQTKRLAEQIAILEQNSSRVVHQVSEHGADLDKKNVLVVIPAFNEELNLHGVVQEILGEGYQLLVVDDGSTDRTRSIALDCGVDVLSLPFNIGVGGALKAGFRRACELGFVAVVQVDADGQHQTDEISSLLRQANRTRAHLVLGSRFRSHTNELEVGFARRFVMRILALSASRATGTHITDATSGFRVIRQPLLSEFSENFPSNYLGDTYEALISAGRSGYIVQEVPASMRNRVNGVSTASNFQAIKFIIKSLLVAILGLHVPIKTYSSDDPHRSH